MKPRSVPAHGRVCRLYLFGHDDGAEQGRTLLDIIEADMTPEQFQRWISKGFAGPFYFMARGEPRREYTIQQGYYHDGEAVFPFTNTTISFTH